MSSAKTPPGPNATRGPKTGSWTRPASSSVPPSIIGCTIDGSADPVCGSSNGVGTRHVEGDAARFRLVCTRLGGLHDHGVAERFGSRHGVLRGGRDTIRDQRNPVRGQQLVRVGRIEPAIVRLRERALDDTSAASRSTSASDWHRPKGPPQPIGPLGGATERPGGRLGEREGGGCPRPDAAPPECHRRS